MRYPGIGIFVVGLLALPFTGCAWFGTSEEEEELRSGSSRQVEIPAGLDEPAFVDMMPIPDINDYRGIGDRETEVGIPAALSTNFGAERIVIRKLGDMQWVFVDSPTSVVWPQVVQYFEENDLAVASLDPRSGLLETEWLFASGATAEELFESLEQGGSPDRQLSSSQHRFRVRMEPGVRRGSTDLYVDHKQLPTGAPFRMTEPDWSSGSDDKAVEGEALRSIAYHLGERQAEDRSVSLLAADLQEENKATLDLGPGGMVLRYRLNFDRAWATVGAALEDARIDVDDLDRSSANYYVHYTLRHDPDPGFLSRLFSFDDDGEEAAGEGNRFRIHLATEGDEIHVTVVTEGAEPDAPMDTRRLLLSERLLKLIKEYST